MRTTGTLIFLSWRLPLRKGECVGSSVSKQRGLSGKPHEQSCGLCKALGSAPQEEEQGSESPGIGAREAVRPGQACPAPPPEGTAESRAA